MEKEDKIQRQVKMTTTMGRELRTQEITIKEITHNNIRTWDNKVTTTNTTTIPRDSRKETTSNTTYWTRKQEQSKSLQLKQSKNLQQEQSEMPQILHQFYQEKKCFHL